MGKEDVGQQSIHYAWTYRDLDVQPQVTGGSILQNEINYIQLWPDNDGGFTASTSAGGDVALPVEEGTADNIYDTPGTNWIQVRASMDIIGTSTPCIAYTRRDNTVPYEINEYVFAYYKDGWQEFSLQTDGFPWSSKPEMTISGDGKIWITTIKAINGVEQLISYLSEDDGVSFVLDSQLTSSTFPSAAPNMTYLSDSAVNLMWSERISRTHSEVRYYELELIPPIQNFIRLKGGGTLHLTPNAISTGTIIIK